jgi:hypothetical protein
MFMDLTSVDKAVVIGELGKKGVKSATIVKELRRITGVCLRPNPKVRTVLKRFCRQMHDRYIEAA